MTTLSEESLSEGGPCKDNPTVEASRGLFRLVNGGEFPKPRLVNSGGFPKPLLCNPQQYLAALAVILLTYCLENFIAQNGRLLYPTVAID